MVESKFVLGQFVTNKKFTVVIATLNSERTLEQCLASIRKQKYPQELVEILVIDGFSTDRTRQIAAQFDCRILDNQKVEPVSAKIIGLREATGDYLIYCDSDEVLESPLALLKRQKAFQENPELRMVFAEGYKTYTGAPFVSQFINEFGDPYSMFYYRLSKDYRFFPEDIQRFARVVKETEDYVVYELDSERGQPILENAASANSSDIKFFRENYPDLLDKQWGPVHFFYHMQDRTRFFAVTKDDCVAHYSSDTWGGLLKKIKWRVSNNLFSGPNNSGFLGREKYSRSGIWRKFLFIPYVLLGIPVLIDSCRYIFTRRDIRYAGIVPLCLYTIFWILFYSLLKTFGYRPRVRGYGT